MVREKGHALRLLLGWTGGSSRSCGEGWRVSKENRRRARRAGDQRLVGKAVNQWVVARGYTWGAKYSLRKPVNRLTGPAKTCEMPVNTGFLRLARPGSADRGDAAKGRNVGAGGSG